MNLRVLIILSLLVGIGVVLHAVAPPIMGMRPDMLLAMMFLGILLFPKTPYVILLGIVTGIMSALTTTFPGGQIASIVEKPVAAFAFFGLFLLTRNLINGNINAPLLTAIGTLISGSVFLFTGLYILGASVGVGFSVLLLTVVLPTMLINSIVMVILYPIVQTILKRTQPLLVS